MHRRPRPGQSCAALLVGAALFVSGCGSGGSAPSHTASASIAPAHASTTKTTGRSTNGGAHAPAVASAEVIALRQSMRRALRLLGNGASAAVYDLNTHQLLFTDRAGVRTPPASVEKLYTTTAVLRLIGPDATLPTQVLGTGHLTSDGVWHGDLYLKGGGDPTFGDESFNHTYEHGEGPTPAELVEQLAAHGIKKVTGHVIGDESLFDQERGGMLTNLKVDVGDFGGQLSALTYDHGAAASLKASPAIYAVNSFVLAMHTAHIDARAARQTAVTPVDAQLLGTVASPPMRILLRLMDVPSDDLIAELLTKQLGVRYDDGVGSIAAGANVISQTISQDYAIHPRIDDGSGLDKADRSSPLDVVTLLRELYGTPTGRVLIAALPVVGVEGTVQTIALKTAAVGHCAAKTGTLDNVTNLAGYCKSRSGDMLAFAVFDEGVPNSVAIPPIGDMVAAVAKY